MARLIIWPNNPMGSRKHHLSLHTRKTFVVLTSIFVKKYMGITHLTPTIANYRSETNKMDEIKR